MSIQFFKTGLLLSLSIYVGRTLCWYCLIRSKMCLFKLKEDNLKKILIKDVKESKRMTENTGRFCQEYLPEAIKRHVRTFSSLLFIFFYEIKRESKNKWKRKIRKRWCLSPQRVFLMFLVPCRKRILAQ